MKQKLDYNLKWAEYFQLDKSSPSGLVRIRDFRGKSIDKYPVGTCLFRKNGTALAWQLSFQEKSYYIHRIVWVMTYGSIDPVLVIDHLDGNPFNNQISNLSLKTIANNARNQRQFSTNTSGITGVSLTSTGCGYFHYTAAWREINGDLKRKYFSIAKLGEETAKLLAIKHREDQLARLILEGADYTERHGV